MGRPVISGDSPTIRSALADREEIVLIERNNPEALADALLLLKENPQLRERVAAAGHARFMSGNSTTAIGRHMKEALLGIVDRE
jgi:glycosyltransferase involved in cell wall biosynthesis